MSVAFVLSGGASLGAIQVGMLRALADHDVRPDLVVGTSVGAVNGAFLACREFAADAVAELAELWLGVRRGQVFPVEPFTGLLGFLGARRNLVPAGALRRLITRNTDCELLEDTPTPLHVIACDVLNDVLPTGGPCSLSEAPRGALGMVVQATSLMVAHRFADETAAYADHPGLTILPPPCPIDVQPMDFGHAAELIDRAEADARAFLEERSRRVIPLPRRRTLRPAS